MQLNITEISDVVDILQERGVEYAISIEPDCAFVYGSEDIAEQVDDILWARQVMPVVCPKVPDMAYSMPKSR